LQSIQAQSLIKNIIKILGFILLLSFPLWISRILLISLYKELSVNTENLGEYLVTAFRFDLKTIAIWYAILFVLLGVNLFLKNKTINLTAKLVFTLLLIGALVFNFINVFYYPISKNIAGAELFSMVGGQETSIITKYITEYWWAVVVILIIAYVSNKLFNVFTTNFNKKQSILVFIIGLILLVAAARGSSSLKPLNSMDAYENLSAGMAKTAMSPTYVLIESYGKSQLQELNYVSKQELNSWTRKNYYVLPQNELNKPNICIVLLESFGKEYTGLNDGVAPSYTPFLDSLMQESLVFSNAYANGLRSKDAVASVYAGIPCLMNQSYIGSLYTNNEVTSLFELLEPLGYSSSFFHAADEQSMGFKAYLKSEGLERYVAKQDYPNKDHFDGTWGIFDEPFLRFFSNELDEQKEPWVSGIFTLSSHHPYKVPDQYKGLPKGNLPIHQSIQYTDIALNNFIKESKSKPWFENTIFIITADHSSTNQTKPYKTFSGKFKVPLMIYAPKYFNSRIDHKPVQHIDIYPTVAELAGYSDTLFSFGTSLLDSTNSTLIHYEGNVYSIIDTTYNLETIGFKKFSMYNLHADSNNEFEMSDSLPEKKEILEHNLKSSLQDFNERIINNNFK
jgi:phosphoglycerol transferase MdoB-like AlkP superfamily enzyme